LFMLFLAFTSSAIFSFPFLYLSSLLFFIILFDYSRFVFISFLACFTTHNCFLPHPSFTTHNHVSGQTSALYLKATDQCSPEPPFLAVHESSYTHIHVHKLYFKPRSQR
jgi:hypothetical protein